MNIDNNTIPQIPLLLRQTSLPIDDDYIDYDHLWESRNLPRNKDLIIELFIKPKRFNYNKLSCKNNRKNVEHYRRVFSSLNKWIIKRKTDLIPVLDIYRRIVAEYM
jgi:hypothetical protein